LREYLGAVIFESRREFRDALANLEKHFDEAQLHQEETLAAFRGEVSRRFDGVNEFRDALSDLSALMATKDNLSRVEEKFEARAAGNAQRITALERRIDLREGEQQGSRITYGNMAALIAASATIIGIIVVASNYLSGG
jgi:DNA anti-recombination protein RmuC